jgi:hypothetical protein
MSFDAMGNPQFDDSRELSEQFYGNIIGQKDAEIARLKDDKDLLTGQLTQSRSYVDTYTKEIERLNESLQSIDDHGRAAHAMEMMKAQKAEIERLSKLYRASLEELVKQGELITELADEFEKFFRSQILDHDVDYEEDGPELTIIKSARELRKMEAIK